MAEIRLREFIKKSLIKNKVVLDIGTGAESLNFIASLSPKKIYAVSHDIDEIEAARESVTIETDIEYIVTDLLMFELGINEKVDVIFAGYFFSAIEGTRPGHLVEVLRKLSELLNDGGILIVEDFYWRKEMTEEQDKLAYELYQKAYEIKDLAKISYPKQMPEEVLVELFKKYDFAVEKVEVEKPHTDEEFTMVPFEKRFSSIKKVVDKLPYSREKMDIYHRSIDICDALRKIGKMPQYTYDYMIIAKRV